MYNVRMKRYTVAQVRERLSEALDSAEAGKPVVIERRGVRFRLEAARPARLPGSTVRSRSAGLTTRSIG